MSDDTANQIRNLLQETIAQNEAETPTEPGLYRLPCGECYVDFFIDAEGNEHWLVPGDDTHYTRETITISRHGEHPWERMLTLDEAAHLLHQRN